ncbi:MAG: flagellar basal body-associated FliL family protein [Spirochaetes bacterium]|nr:flagellar basal body-associated FliL family protein [Spirochaetota bacterium]
MADKLDDLNKGEEVLDEEEQEEGGGEEEKQAKKGVKLVGPGFIKIILIIIGLILLIAISVTVSYFVTKSMVEKPQMEATYESTTAKLEPYSTWEPGEFSINTADIDEVHFVSVKIALAFDKNNTILASELDSRKAQIRDMINNILSSKFMRELVTIEGKNNLKLEIKNSINNILKNGRISDVYFIDFVVQ